MTGAAGSGRWVAKTQPQQTASSRLSRVRGRSAAVAVLRFIERDARGCHSTLELSRAVRQPVRDVKSRKECWRRPKTEHWLTDFWRRMLTMALLKTFGGVTRVTHKLRRA